MFSILLNNPLGEIGLINWSIIHSELYASQHSSDAGDKII